MSIDLRPGPCRVLLFQPALPQYRRAFFSRLGRCLDTLTLVHGQAALRGEPPAAHCDLDAVRTVAVTHRRFGPMLWMPAMGRVAEFGQHDVTVFSWNSRYAHLPMAILQARRAGQGVGLWGHGYSTTAETRSRRRVRNLLARWADAVITYNRRAAHALVDGGIAPDRVFVAPNALDGDAIESAARVWRADREALMRFQQRLGLDGGPVALYVSRLGGAANLRVLVETWRLVATKVPRAKLLIVGDGPARPQLLTHIAERGLSGSIRCVGAVYGEESIAPYFLSTRLMLHPVKIGLSLNHAMSYGVPVATFDDAARHSPEFEALRDGVNGVVAPAGDVAALARRATAVLEDPALARCLGCGARETMHAAYSLDAMVEKFLAAIQRARAASEERSRPIARRSGAVVGEPVGR